MAAEQVHDVPISQEFISLRLFRSGYPSRSLFQMTIRASADASLSVKFPGQCRLTQEIGKGDRRSSTLEAAQPRDNQNTLAPKVPQSLNDPCNTRACR